MTSTPEDTGSKQAATQFKPGQSGNPAGRPKGARSKLAESFVADLLDDWKDNGKAAIVSMREDKPGDYVKVVASLLPKQVEIKEDLFDGLTDDQLAAIIALADSHGGGEGEADAGAEAGAQSARGVPAVH